MPGIVINEDDSHFFMDRTDSQLDHAGLCDLVDHYALGQVTDIFYNPNAMRTSYASKVFEPIWHGVQMDVEGRLVFRGKRVSTTNSDDTTLCRWILSAKKLHERGINPYKVWIDHTRKRGRSPWISMRMNDIHCVDDPDCFMHSEFWRNHPQYHRMPYQKAGGWPARALDFNHPEVRDRMLALLREYLAEFDPDGFEFDWMRFGWHFRPGYEDIGRETLAAFHRQIRAMVEETAQKRGHPIRIAVRVPARPEDAFDLGFDVAGWVREKLVDWVTPTAFWATTDTQMPIALWRRLVGDDVTLAAGLELLVRPDPQSDAFRSTAACVMGQAANYFAQGANRLYLFNFMDSTTAMRSMEEYRDVLHFAGQLDTAARQPRRHILTYVDTRAMGTRTGNVLPEKLQPDGYTEFRWDIGPKPENSRSCQLCIGTDTPVSAETFAGYFNGIKLACLQRVDVSKKEEVPWDSSVPEAFRSERDIPETTRFLISFDIREAIKAGRNVAELQNVSKLPQTITWAEVNIKT